MNLITRNYRPQHARSVALHACARAASPLIATYRCLHGCLQPPSR